MQCHLNCFFLDIIIVSDLPDSASHSSWWRTVATSFIIQIWLKNSIILTIRTIIAATRLLLLPLPQLHDQPEQQDEQNDGLKTEEGGSEVSSML